MSKLSPLLALVLIALVGTALTRAQMPAKASLTVKTKMSIGGKKIELSRKRWSIA
jgi:hypothetical protein